VFFLLLSDCVFSILDKLLDFGFYYAYSLRSDRASEFEEFPSSREYLEVLLTAGKRLYDLKSAGDLAFGLTSLADCLVAYDLFALNSISIPILYTRFYIADRILLVYLLSSIIIFEPWSDYSSSSFITLLSSTYCNCLPLPFDYLLEPLVTRPLYPESSSESEFLSALLLLFEAFLSLLLYVF